MSSGCSGGFAFGGVGLLWGCCAFGLGGFAFGGVLRVGMAVRRGRGGRRLSVASETIWGASCAQGEAYEDQ